MFSTDEHFRNSFALQLLESKDAEYTNVEDKLWVEVESYEHIQISRGKMV